MKWSIRVGRIRGIDVYFHVTFLMLIAALLVVDLLSGRELAAAVTGVVTILSLFGCVLLHELGHAFAAARYGIRTRDITLLPIGGVARLERIPRDPRQEMVVALAGPAVNLAIAAVLVAVLAATGTEITGSIEQAGFGVRLLVTNVFLFAFNLLPAFPMDGGRVLRAILALRIDYARASDIAARIGQGMAFLFGLVGLFWNPFLLFIALFIYMGAEQEAALARVRSATDGLPVRTAMVTNFRTIRGDEPLSRAIELLLEGCQHDFPVLEHGDRIAGVITRDDLLAAVGRRGLESPARDAIRRETFLVSDDEMLEDVLLRMQASGVSSVPVVRSGALAGLVTLENVGELLMVQSALKRNRSLSGGARPGPARPAAPNA